jgi:hypothetical protein
MKVLFRYIRKPQSQYDWDGVLDTKLIEVELREFSVVRETLKCYFIKIGIKEKRILKDAKNTFAYLDKEDAIRNFFRRQMTALSHAERQYKTSKAFFNLSVKMRKESLERIDKTLK